MYIAILFTEQPSEEIITEKKSSSDPQQVVEDAIKSGSEEPTPKEPNSGNIFTTSKFM